MKTLQKTIMKSINFEFLRNQRPVLADLGAFAEQYAHTDKESALVKLRIFAETMVSSIYTENNLYSQYGSSFCDMLNNVEFSDVVDRRVINKLDLLRKQGNKGAHGNARHVKTYDLINYIKDAYTLAKWFSLTYYNTDNSIIPEFNSNALAISPEVKASKEKKHILEKLLAKEDHMKHLIDELDAARKKISEQEKISKTHKEKLLKQSSKVATILDFSEEETRKQLIDEMIIEAGWDISDNDQVTIEEKVKHQPTDSGFGYADYVLWGDDGKPLAVIEAKKTAYDVIKGKKQAIDYADGLEKEYKQRPIIFFTNGYDIRLLDDVKGEPERKVYGYYSKASLKYLIIQRTSRKKLTDKIPDNNIIDRLYQIEAVKRVTERFENDKKRKALIIQATGTGKTRVAIALCELMFRANWAKRVLFLCDRKELRKQAKNTFTDKIDDVPPIIVSRRTSKDKDSRIYLATYPAMMKCYQSFDIGFFDLIIADESHRSIYNRYLDLFLYFDAYQVGLTATPVNFIHRNTYSMFQCDDLNPTVFYSYEDAIAHSPRWLSPFRVTKHTSKFLREGIKYNKLSKEERDKLDREFEDSELIDYSREQISKDVFNKDTDRNILRNLMENGVKNADGSHVGKTIIFARNHKHAVLLNELFLDEFSQYGSTFCQVIDNYSDRAEQLIDDFKDDEGKKDLTIAISVDMMDTGIDVPAVVNLVFAKPIKSYVKFWQMIGRGTRLCKDLLGHGKDKEYFQIFDHWGNFEYFDQHEQEYEPAKVKSLMQKVFDQRINLAESALLRQEPEVFKTAIDMIAGDISSLPEKTIAVKEKWKEKQTYQNKDILLKFTAPVIFALRNDIAPLMQWKNLNGEEAAYRFDILILKIQNSVVGGNNEYLDLKLQLINQVASLPINLSQVTARIETIKTVQKNEYWEKENLNFNSLENTRIEIRGIMKYMTTSGGEDKICQTFDIKDGDFKISEHKVNLKGLDLIEYKMKLKELFDSVFDKSPVLQKIKAGKKITNDELDDFISRVKYASPDFSIDDLLDNFPTKNNRIELIIRQIIGMDYDAINQCFDSFIQKHPDVSSFQIKFLDMLKSYISKYGSIELEKLYEAPFNSIHVDGIDGVFQNEECVDDIVKIVNKINDGILV